ncbi:MAG TPA: chemotaxis response regulator protein-glutamate methylesterase [Gammaproteobacteria bacterium]|nr:chemotaxis response regulator protein-glutamate methylesterase [Gammaproteobacteria bacterium]
MVTRVLVVDDSGFFRRRIVEILQADGRLQVVGTAGNGREAIDQVAALKPDVVTMDIEMPVMDGISAVRQIMASHPTPVLMFSSLTHAGAQATLEALEAGAVDFLPKKFDDIARNREQATELLRQRILAVARRRLLTRAVAGEPAPQRPRPAAPAPEPVPAPGRYEVVAIASSTGGPVALQQVLTRLPADFPLPLLLVQHMPASFTPAFAQRLDQQCAIEVREAADGDRLAPGRALLAPGGRQMRLEQQQGEVRVRIEAGPAGLHYKPCADLTFASLAGVYGGRVLAAVLTGMGADGREGARRLKADGATVWAQDEDSCVIFGMPAAVIDAGIADRVVALRDIGPSLARIAGV